MYGSAQSNPGDVLDRNSLSEMNLKVLKRIDPHTEELLASAGHVALYDFQTGEKKWVHKGVEGTLFLIRRGSVPIFRYIVLNKKSQDHYMEDLHNGFKFEAGERYGRMFLLYKNCKSEVVGIWFYDTEECEKVISLLQGIASQHPQPPQPQTDDGAPASYPLTIGALPPYSPATPPSDVQSLGLVATPEKAFWDRGASPAPISGNPLHSADGHTLADAPGLTPRPGSQPQPPSLPSNPLERLFGLSSSRAASTQAAPANSTPPLPPTGSHGGIPPAPRNTESPQTGSRLHEAKTPPTSLPLWLTSSLTPPNGTSAKTTRAEAPLPNLPTPFAEQQPHQSSRGSIPQPLPSASLPSLLKPSFFQASASAAGSSRLPDLAAAPPATPPTQSAHSQTNSAPSQTLHQTDTQEAFTKLFNVRDKGKGPQTPKEQHAAEEVHKSLESLVQETQLRNGMSGRPSGEGAASRGPDRRALVRSAIKTLADSDAFIDIIVGELDKSGLLRQ